MHLLLFGATGMVGQGVLREALAAPDVTDVTIVNRAPTGLTHPKLREIVHGDPGDLTPLADRLAGVDACIWAVGVTSLGTDAATYARITRDMPVAAATTLARINPEMIFVYVSAAGARPSARGWAGVKGDAEQALRALPFRQVVAFRPGAIQPLDGIRSRTGVYNLLYALTGPLLRLVRPVAPGLILTTRTLGQALLQAARGKATRPVLESADIAALQ